MDDGNAIGLHQLQRRLPSQEPPYDAYSFSKLVTRDASPAGGSAPACIPNTLAAWDTLFDWGKTKNGRDQIKSAMGICPDVDLDEDWAVEWVAEWVQSAWDYMVSCGDGSWGWGLVHGLGKGILVGLKFSAPLDTGSQSHVFVGHGVRN